MPPGLREVLLICLQADPENRYRTAGELARELDLCLKPATRRLLHPEPGWRTWARRHPLLTLYPTGLVPSVLASWFSIEYNKVEIVDRLPEAAEMFRLLQFVVNGTLFPLGMLLFGLICWPVAKGLWRLHDGQTLTPEELAALRRRSLRLGTATAVICLSAWVFAGFVFPIALHLTVRAMRLEFYLHFLASQTLCGLITISYPLFGITAVATRAIYPAFLPGATLPPAEAKQLDRLDRSLNWYLLFAASVPMLAIGLLALNRSGNYLALGVLSVAGAAGFAVAYLLVGTIRADRAALMELTTSHGN
jgi:hypothetical protein